MSNQEIWITIRFKGETNIEWDAKAVARELSIELQKSINSGDASHEFETCREVSVLEICEEADICGNREKVCPHPRIFTESEVDAALCIWECMVENRSELEGLEIQWENRGTCEMRQFGAALGKQAESVWQALTPDECEFCSPFDWDFIPQFCKLVDWKTATIDGNPRQIADRIISAIQGRS